MKKQLDSLTGLRGVAAYSVLIAHSISAAFLYSGLAPFAAYSSRLAYFGMSLFFVLSGFVIHYNYATLITSEGFIKGGYRFITARIARLYPLYALALFFGLDSLPSSIFHNKQWSELAFITMTQSWFNLQMTFYAPAWSISTEWFFYFAFLLLLPIFERIKGSLFVLSGFLIAVFFTLPYLVNIQNELYVNNNGWVIYFSPYTRIFEFIAGILASQAYVSSQLDSYRNSIMATVATICSVIWCAGIILFDPLKSSMFSILLSNFVYAPAIAPMLYLLCKYDTFLSRLFSSKPLMFMGEISYSVYLLGFMIMTGVGEVYVNHSATPMAYINSLIKVFVIVTFTTFIAYGSYNLFERPARNFLRNLFMANSRKKDNCNVPEVVMNT